MAADSTPPPGDHERADAFATISETLKRMYRHRFGEAEIRRKEVLWRTVCGSFLQRYVDPAGTVLDLGAGSCEFINHIEAKRKIAVDLNPDTKLLARDAEVLLLPSTDLSPVESNSVDVVFTSNFFEHLHTTAELLATLSECRRILVPGGRLVVVMPNIRYVPGRFWDYLDHHLPLTHLSLTEALVMNGFATERVVPRFLPYTVKGTRLPVAAPLIQLYLRLPIVWPLFGRQMLVIART
jgi:SAM-dependent methyltransferase